jgi:hypothetical protein
MDDCIIELEEGRSGTRKLWRRLLVPGPLLAALACLAFSFLLRFFMAGSMHGSVVWGLQGALRDVLPGSLLAWAIYRFQPQGIWGAALRTLLSLWVVFLVSLCVSDLVYFFQCDTRLDRALVENLSWTSLKPALTASALLAAVCGLALALGLGWGTWRLSFRGPRFDRFRWPHWARMAVWVAIILGGTFQWAGKVAASPTDVAAVKADEILGEGQAETLAGIMRGMWQTGPDWVKPGPVALSREDQAWAVEKGLAMEPSAGRQPFPGRWHRVVVVAVESLAAAFLDPHNPRRPAGMTPFLDSLQAANPHLDACYSAGMDTEQGQFSLMAGRTDFEWGEHPYPGPSLFSLARSAGYDTCMLFGDTLHFRSHDMAYPMALHVGRVYGKESFVSRRPDRDFCSWGGALCDRAVFDEAAAYLQQHRAKPVLLLVDTLDTHPPYYWQKPEAGFPAAVRERTGGLAKALNQLDDNLRRFFQGLRERGMLDQGTLVVITADHFPAYGDESLAMSGAPDHRTNRIPMIFVAGGASALGRLDQDRLSSQLDLAPTLAALMGLPAAGQFMGRDLFSPGPGRALSREKDLLRLRIPGQPDEMALCDSRGLPVDRGTPLARWYRWRLGGL